MTATMGVSAMGKSRQPMSSSERPWIHLLEFMHYTTLHCTHHYSLVPVCSCLCRHSIESLRQPYLSKVHMRGSEIWSSQCQWKVISSRAKLRDGSIGRDYCHSKSESGEAPVQVHFGLFLADQRGRYAHSHHHSTGFVAEAGISTGEEKRGETR